MFLRFALFKRRERIKISDLIDVEAGNGELRSESFDLFGELLHLTALVDLAHEVRQLLGASARLQFNAELDGLVEEAADLLRVGLQVAARGDGWSTHADAARRGGGLVTHDGVLIQSDVESVAELLDLASSETARLHVDQHEVVDGAARDECVSAIQQLFCHGLRIRQNLLLVGLEFRGLNAAHVGCDRANFLVVWPTLEAGEHSIVNLLGQIALIFA
mmetsp:Transcript_23351/g.31269  ORF Transcript_23351/g.31269 Transcript_23351/m.31269 type:complete len:218 (+) Transcript_23351:53-706(+)